MVLFARVLSLITFSSFASAHLSTSDEITGYNGSHFDFIVLGGGTAGLVVANRLSEDPSITVAVVEAGSFELDNANVTNTTINGLGKNTRVDWQYKTAPQIYAANETIIYSAGKGVGGSSLINGMTYMRPSDSQIDLWPSLGLEIDWNILFNCSKKSEAFSPPGPQLRALGADYVPSAHGYDGLLTTCVSPHITSTDIHNTFNDTMKNMGVRPRYEFNGGDLIGFGIQEATQNERLDVREDAGRAYYYPFANRPNLVMIVNTTATNLVWSQEKEESKIIASAASLIDQQGKLSTIFADREIILSAGALRSPAILEYSGIGNPTILSQYNIDVKVDLSAVGENLQDQTTMGIVGAALGPNTTGFLPFVSNVRLQDLFGDNTSSVYEAARAKLPEYAATIAAQNGGSSSAIVQEQLLRSQLELLIDSNTPTSEIVPLAISNFIGCVFWPLQPFSRGSVHINGTDKTQQPYIDPRFFQIDFDGQLAVATAKWARQFLITEPVASLVNKSTIAPSFKAIPEEASDDLWLDWVKTKSNFQPNYHHSGTCAMLPRNSGGVVDNDFRVYGTSNVRVVDLSILPLQIAGHSMAPLYGIAEWASEKIKASI